MNKLGLFNEIIDKYDYFIFDCDGVIFHIATVLGDSIPLLHLLAQKNKKRYFYSNNSKRTSKELAQRFLTAGYTPDPLSVISTPYLSALFLRLKYPTVRTVFLLGNENFRAELETRGFNVITDPAIFSEKDKIPPQVEAVVTGCDLQFTYQKLACCAELIKKGAHFIVADYDAYFMIEGFKCPASAFIHFPLQLLSGKKPVVICKPAPFALELIMERDGIPKECKDKILMIGDSMETDIAFGINAGIDTLLVLSGVTKEEAIEKYEVKPKYVMDVLKINMNN